MGKPLGCRYLLVAAADLAASPGKLVELERKAARSVLTPRRQGSWWPQWQRSLPIARRAAPPPQPPGNYRARAGTPCARAVTVSANQPNGADPSYR